MPQQRVRTPAAVLSAEPVGDVSNSEAFAAAVATGDDGADLAALRPVESPDEERMPPSNAPVID